MRGIFWGMLLLVGSASAWGACGDGGFSTNGYGDRTYYDQYGNVCYTCTDYQVQTGQCNPTAGGSGGGSGGGTQGGAGTVGGVRYTIQMQAYKASYAADGMDHGTVHAVLYDNLTHLPASFVWVTFDVDRGIPSPINVQTYSNGECWTDIYSIESGPVLVWASAPGEPNIGYTGIAPYRAGGVSARQVSPTGLFSGCVPQTNTYPLPGPFQTTAGRYWDWTSSRKPCYPYGGGISPFRVELKWRETVGASTYYGSPVYRDYGSSPLSGSGSDTVALCPYGRPGQTAFWNWLYLAKRKFGGDWRYDLPDTGSNESLCIIQ